MKAKYKGVIMNISKESLQAYNNQLDNGGNDAYRKAHKLGSRVERVVLASICRVEYGITGGHRKLTKKIIESYNCILTR